MENKIAALCSLLTEYYKERKGFSFEVIKGEPALIVEGCEWYGKTFEECTDKAIDELEEWLKEE